MGGIAGAGAGGQRAVSRGMSVVSMDGPGGSWTYGYEEDGDSRCTAL